MDRSYSCQFSDDDFMLFEAIRIKTLSLFKRPVKGPHLLLQSEPFFLKTADPIAVPNTFELIIRQ